jgi:hypothetical protein
VNRFLLVAALALALPGVALAKGPSAASISGPGIDTITLSGDAESGATTPFSTLTQTAGFFSAVYEPQPDPMLRVRPKGDLGPRYRIAWVLPTPMGKSTLRQDVYPYAKPYAVTYMRPGQTFYGGSKTNGGWFVGGYALKQALVAIGLPRQVQSDSSGLSAAALGGISAGGVAVLALSVLLVLRLRRKPAS